MKQIWESFCVCFSAVILLMVFPFQAGAEITLSTIYVADVTPSEFTIVWRASEVAIPKVSIFSDAAGTSEITHDLETVFYPLRSGNPDLAEPFYLDESKDLLRAATQGAGLMAAKIRGTSPDTAYHVRIGAENYSGDVAWYPGPGTTFPVHTMTGNDFTMGTKQLLITLTNHAGDLDASGWVVIASTEPPAETRFPVSAVVGDGAGPNQAYIDLSNLFNLSSLNWNPAAGPYDIKIEIMGDLPDIESPMFTINLSDAFHVSDVEPVTLNVDGPLDTDHDGVPDEEDLFPLDPNEWADNDLDGIGDNADPDDDNDGMPDTYELSNGFDPLTDDAFSDSDSDGYSNLREYLSGSSPVDGLDLPPLIGDADADHDVDGADLEALMAELGNTGCDAALPCVFDLDQDGDVDEVDLKLFIEDFGTGVWDDDRDMDGVPDEEDLFPLDPNEWADNDLDGIGDNADPDDDNDGMPDAYESANGFDPFSNDAFADHDSDGYSNIREYLSGSSPVDGLDLPPLIGDADADHDVDGADLIAFISALGTTGCDLLTPCTFDLDHDGDVDEVDLQLFLEDYARAGD